METEYYLYKASLTLLIGWSILTILVHKIIDHLYNNWGTLKDNSLHVISYDDSSDESIDEKEKESILKEIESFPVITEKDRLNKLGSFSGIPEKDKLNILNKPKLNAFWLYLDSLGQDHFGELYELNKIPPLSNLNMYIMSINDMSIYQKDNLFQLLVLNDPVSFIKRYSFELPLKHVITKQHTEVDQMNNALSRLEFVHNFTNNLVFKEPVNTIKTEQESPRVLTVEEELDALRKK